ncbi:hypothetical protein N7447_007765 [Penicillium robsamsonii]|uniref:uncharacterized protein n=1 Tax=Penicillium robsamsonii TaxID=1792511 RepID=UPI00254895E2|nr:uncharacterized protein N7447_007765 [Penicillium robsamsonii]KAJ5817757.1 hypothetical protein N7447_007765 [Penicillium robsamsonii]
MDQEDPNLLIAHQPRKLRLLYEPLCLLHTLSEVRGDRIKPGEESMGSTQPKYYRNFVDAIAYICAYQKKPGYVTAVALEETPDAIVILIAANGGIDRAVRTLLEDVCLIILWIVENSTLQLNTEEGQGVMKILTDYVLPLNAPKIFEYYQQVNKSVSSVMGGLNTEPGLKDHSSIIKLRNWFSAHLSKEGVQLQECDMPALALSSYKDRKLFTALHQTSESLEQCRKFERLHKLLYKLGKHVARCKRLVESTIGLRLTLSRGLRIETIGASPENPIILMERTCTIQKISNRMFSDPAKRNVFLQQLQRIYTGKELDRVLSKDVCKGKTRVHAELLVLDHFEQTGGRFLDERDRYIGCSKPACYLCHLFISCHPGRYATPPSHQKLYMNWRLPDIRANEQNAGMRFQRQQDVLPRMTETVRRDLKNDIATGVGKRMAFPDSTAGGSSTIFEIDSDLGPSMAALSLDGLRKKLAHQHEAVRAFQEPHIDSRVNLWGIPSISSEGSEEAESDDDSTTGGVKV